MIDTILRILQENGIDPNLTDGKSPRTAYEYLESVVMGALDEIQEWIDASGK